MGSIRLFRVHAIPPFFPDFIEPLLGLSPHRVDYLYIEAGRLDLVLQAPYYLFFETVQAIPLKFLTLKALYLVFIVSSPQASEMAARVYRPHLSSFSMRAPSLPPPSSAHKRPTESQQHQALCFLILFISKKCAPFLPDSGGLKSSSQMQTYSSCWESDAFILKGT